MKMKMPNSVLSIFFKMTIPLWFLFVPLGICINIICLPYICLRKIFFIDSNAKQTMGVKIYGENNKKTLVFVHGWPDSGELWNDIVATLKCDYRCIVLTLPGFVNANNTSSCWGYDFDQIRDLIIGVINLHTRKNEKVTLVSHDWGAFFSYYTQKTIKDKIERMVTLDIGCGKIEQTAKMYTFLVTYQLFNVVCFLLGHPGGDVLQRIFLKLFNYEARPHNEINASMNYNYYYMWKTIFTNPKKLKNFPRTTAIELDTCPIYFAYGTGKPGMFHSERFIQHLESNNKCKVEKFNCSHWITVDKGDDVLKSIAQFLKDTDG